MEKKIRASEYSITSFIKMIKIIQNWLIKKSSNLIRFWKKK